MQAWASYARGVFWVLGALHILTGLYFWFFDKLDGPLSQASIYGLVHAVVSVGIISIGAILCGAAFAWHRKTSWARPLVALASLIQLIYFPIGTAAGAVGLYWCFSRRLREAETPPEISEYRSQAGDATHPWIQKALPLFSLVLIFASFRFLDSWGLRMGLPEEDPMPWFAMVLLVQFLCALCHELGHAVGAWSGGMKLAKFQVGPLDWTCASGKWSFRFCPAAILFGGGAVASHPLYKENLRSRMVVEVLAGPVASFVLAWVGFLFLLLAPGSSWESWWRFPGLLAAIAMGDFLLNMIPFAMAAGFSDGALLVQLVRGGPFADLRRLWKLIGLSAVSPARLRDLDPGILSRGAQASVGRPDEGVLKIIEMLCAIDRGDLALARHKLEEGLRLIPSPAKALDPVVAAEICFYMTYLDGHSRRSARWLEETESFAKTKKVILADEWDYWRAVLAVRMAEGDKAGADLAWSRARKFGDILPKTGMVQLERELLQAVYHLDWLQRQELLALQVSLNQEEPESAHKPLPPKNKAVTAGFGLR